MWLPTPHGQWFQVASGLCGGDTTLTLLPVLHRKLCAVGAVLWSTPVLWPDFQREHLLEAMGVYREQTIECED